MWGLIRKSNTGPPQEKQMLFSSLAIFPVTSRPIKNNWMLNIAQKPCRLEQKTGLLFVGGTTFERWELWKRMKSFKVYFWKGYWVTSCLLACLLLSFSALTLNNSMASLSTHKWTGHVIWTTLHHHLPSERMLFLSTNLKSVNTMDSALQGLKSQAKVNFPTVEFNFYQDFLFRVFTVIRFGKTVFCTRNR